MGRQPSISLGQHGQGSCTAASPPATPIQRHAAACFILSSMLMASLRHHNLAKNLLPLPSSPFPRGGVGVHAHGSQPAGRPPQVGRMQQVADQQAAGSRQQAAGSRQQAAGSRQKAAGSRKQAPGSRQQAAGSRQQAAGSRQQAAGSRQQAAGSRQQAAGSRQSYLHLSKICRSSLWAALNSSCFLFMARVMRCRMWKRSSGRSGAT